MRILPEIRGCALSFLLVSVLCSTVLSLGRDVEVVGYAESSKIKIPHAFSGLRVTIECKTAKSKDHFITRGNGEVDEITGKFNLNIPHDIVGDDENLKEACYAQLHSASGNPCPAHDGLEASKIVFLSKTEEKHVFGLKQHLKFSPEVCISKFFWHMPKFPLPPPLDLPPLMFPKIKKPCPPIYKPPVVFLKKPCLPKIAHKPIYKFPVPIYKPPVVIPKKPYPPKIAHKPIYKPPVPIYKPPVVIPKKPCPPLPKPFYKPPVPIYKPIYKPPVPIYKPPVPIYKPIYKPPVPIYKPIYKPPVPIYKPPVPIYKPIYKPPVVIPKKPCPPITPVPIYKPPVVVIPKKPCPPLPKLPTFPPKYIPHPKFGKWPPFPSHP